ncbi:MAG: hypothetical protein ABJE47_05420 [bacterium]
MRIPSRLLLAASVLAIAGACSKTSAPALPDDLKQDLAKAGGADIQLAGSAAPRVDVVSASERTLGSVPVPKARTTARAPGARHEADTPAPSQGVPEPAPAPAPRAVDDAAPITPPVVDPAPSAIPAAGRPEAPKPSTQREPRGGWRTPGEVIRRAPFPINP